MANLQTLEMNVSSTPTSQNDITDVVLSQNENGRLLYFHILGISIPADSTAYISGTKPDGVVYSKAGSVEGDDYVVVQEDTQMTAVAGTWGAKIYIENDGNLLATALVRISIDKDPVAPGSVPSSSQLDGIVAECQAYAESARSAAYGSPLVAAEVADMVDHGKVYVYVGSEAGMTNGNWYYYDGEDWTSGGVYNSEAVQIDDTLSTAGVAADAKAVGDRLVTYSDPNNDGNIVITFGLGGVE